MHKKQYHSPRKAWSKNMSGQKKKQMSLKWNKIAKSDMYTINLMKIENKDFLKNC